MAVKDLVRERFVKRFCAIQAEKVEDASKCHGGDHFAVSPKIKEYSKFLYFLELCTVHQCNTQGANDHQILIPELEWNNFLHEQRHLYLWNI